MSIFSIHHAAGAAEAAADAAEAADAPDASDLFGGLVHQKPIDAGTPRPQTSHLFRNESLVSDADLRVDIAKNYERYVAGDEEISVKTATLGANGFMAFMRGTRDRTAGSFRQRTSDSEVTMTVKHSVDETVEGGVLQQAVFSAEAMIGGAYANTILGGPYMRLAAWVDSMAWGAWAEADVVRLELSLLMIRSHFGYAHAAGLRLTMASRLIDDFQTRSISKGTWSISGTTYMEAGDPAGGVQNEA